MSIFKNRTVIGVICILLALVICFGITPLFNRGISQKAEIVRVTKDIHAGELITKDMVTTAEVGSYNLPSGLMTTKNNVVGKYAKADLAVGDYILAAKLSEAPAAENAYLYNLDGTKQAISVTIKSFATGPVSYTHLDVYKRQVVLCLRATSNSAVSALMFFLFMVSLLAILSGCRSCRTTIAQRFRGKASNAVEKNRGLQKSKPLHRCYRNSSTKVSSTFITLRCPSGDSVFNRSESSVA